MRRWALLVAVTAVLAGAGVAAAASLGLSSASLTVTTKTLTRQTCTIAPSQDTYVDSTRKSSSFGSSPSLLVSRNSLIGYLQFDLTGCSFPGGATVDSASLRVVVTATPSSRTLSVYPATSAWAPSMTWNGGQPTYASPASATIATGAETGMKSTDVTADVDGWLTGATTNFGWRIADDGGGNATTTLGSMEDSGNAPSLVVTYVY